MYILALAHVAQLVGASSKGLRVQFLVRAQRFQFDPQLGAIQEAH